MKKNLSIIILIILLFNLFACSKVGTKEDAEQFMKKSLAKPTGKIPPPPEFLNHSPFVYSASHLKDPFDPPAKVVKARVFNGIVPDLTRTKGFLESIPFNEFKMVGTIRNEKGIWALVSAKGSVFQVKVGDYLGESHGEIMSITETQIQITEIINADPGFWEERTTILKLEKSY